jgi:hypothetical protein
MEFVTGKLISPTFSKGGPRPARQRPPEADSGEAGGGILLRGRLYLTGTVSLA